MSAEIEKVYYNVKEAAKDVGVTPSNIRYWDDRYHIVEKRGKNDKRFISVKELLVFHKINTLRKFMNLDGIDAVLRGDINIQINKELL